MVFALLVILFATTDLDLWLSDLFFDFSRRKFFWRETWWANQLIHKGGRLAVVGLALACGLLFMLSLLKRGGQRLVDAQRAFLFLLLSLAVGPGTVAGLKLVVNRPYPEHIQRYQGKMPYTKLFQGLPEGAKKYPGFPAAHASAGYALMALYFIFRDGHKRMAYGGLAAGLIIGTLFAFGQQARGMHYASHNVWSVAICWYGVLFLYLVPFRRRANGPMRMASGPRPEGDQGDSSSQTAVTPAWV